MAIGLVSAPLREGEPRRPRAREAAEEHQAVCSARRGPAQRHACRQMAPTAAGAPDGGAAALKRRLRHALKRTRRAQIFVELFAGSGALSRGLEHVSGFACMAMDITNGVDLTHPAVRSLIAGWLRARVVRGVWVGFPCTTWSVARRPALRSKAYVWGLPGLNASEQDQIRNGNATVRAAVCVLREFLRSGIPAVAENPLSSLAWQLPLFVHSAQSPGVRNVSFDFCAFGTPWKKPTRLWSAHCHIEQLGKQCGGPPGRCHTGRGHVRLSGRGPDGRLRTKVAEPYTARLAVAAAHALASAADRIEVAHHTSWGTVKGRQRQKWGLGTVAAS